MTPDGREGDDIPERVEVEGAKGLRIQIQRAPERVRMRVNEGYGGGHDAF